MCVCVCPVIRFRVGERMAVIAMATVRPMIAGISAAIVKGYPGG